MVILSLLHGRVNIWDHIPNLKIISKVGRWFRPWYSSLASTCIFRDEFFEVVLFLSRENQAVWRVFSGWRYLAHRVKSTKTNAIHFLFINCRIYQCMLLGTQIHSTRLREIERGTVRVYRYTSLNKRGWPFDIEIHFFLNKLCFMGLILVTGIIRDIFIWSDTKWNNVIWARLPTTTLILAPNVISLCTTAFVVANVIILIGLILVTAPNVILWLSLYIYFGII